MKTAEQKARDTLSRLSLVIDQSVDDLQVRFTMAIFECQKITLKKRDEKIKSLIDKMIKNEPDVNAIKVLTELRGKI